MINYTLPDFTVNLGLNLFFSCGFWRERPEMAREGVAVTSLYGCFPGCVMNGGRTYLRERTSPAAMERTFAIMAEYGLVPRLTFTNSLVSEETFADPYFNDICLAAARFGGEAIVYDDAAGLPARELRHAARALPPRARWPTPPPSTALARAYDWIVLSYNIHKARWFSAAPEKAEIMVNEFCVPGCPTAPSTTATTAPTSEGGFPPLPCKKRLSRFFDHAPNHPVQFTAEECRRHTSARFGISASRSSARRPSPPWSRPPYLIRPECPSARALLAREMRRS